MIRIVGLQRSHQPDSEFLLLQNQGNLRISLKGHAVLSEAALQLGVQEAMHVFSEDVSIAPGSYVVLFTGEGVSRWCRSRDGSVIYHAYMNRSQAVWSDLQAPIHVLSTHHTFTERREAVLMV